MARKLYRSLEDRRIAGICGGLAEYFDIDPTIVRLIAVILAFTGGGILIYLVAWLIIPYPPVTHQNNHVS
ncbi:MAG: PspC domain-containing protein [candidate division Zixibacteria bacterium]|nr:PspC domain-containing protein [candidate division Zixibacteria bacterium]